MKFSLQEEVALRAASVELRKEQMHSYQREGFEFMRLKPFSALFLDLGLGKSVTSLTVIDHLLRQDFFGTDKILIIGPIRVITDTWPNEIAKWQHTSWLDYSLIRVDDDDPRFAEVRRRTRARCRLDGMGEFDTEREVRRAEADMKAQIMKELATSKARIHIINREAVEWLVTFWDRKWPYRTVFIDESHSFKDISTNRFKAISAVRRAGLITRMHLMTATPAAETYEHLFAQMYLLDLGERLGKSITNYRQTYFAYNGYGRKWKLRKGCEELILDKIKDICLVMKAEDYLPVDAPTIVPRIVTLSERQTALYKKMETDSIVTLADGTEIEAETAAALSAKLLQMSSGVLYETKELLDWETEDMKRVTKVHTLHDHKIEALKEIIEELDGEPLLVAYHFKSSLDRLKKAFPKCEVVDRQASCMKAWNAGKIPLLLMHPQSASEGLNMQKGGHNLIFFDLPWSLTNYLQTIGRLARQGQKKHVVVQLLLARGTLDEYVYKCLIQKKDAQDRLFRILKKKIAQARQQLPRSKSFMEVWA